MFLQNFLGSTVKGSTKDTSAIQEGNASGIKITKSELTKDFNQALNNRISNNSKVYKKQVVKEEISSKELTKKPPHFSDLAQAVKEALPSVTNAIGEQPIKTSDTSLTEQFDLPPEQATSLNESAPIGNQTKDGKTLPHTMTIQPSIDDKNALSDSETLLSRSETMLEALEPSQSIPLKTSTLDSDHLVLPRTERVDINTGIQVTESESKIEPQLLNDIKSSTLPLEGLPGAKSHRELELTDNIKLAPQQASEHLNKSAVDSTASPSQDRTNTEHSIVRKTEAPVTSLSGQVIEPTKQEFTHSVAENNPRPTGAQIVSDESKVSVQSDTTVKTSMNSGYYVSGNNNTTPESTDSKKTDVLSFTTAPNKLHNTDGSLLKTELQPESKATQPKLVESVQSKFEPVISSNKTEVIKEASQIASNEVKLKESELAPKALKDSLAMLTKAQTETSKTERLAERIQTFRAWSGFNQNPTASENSVRLESPNVTYNHLVQDASSNQLSQTQVVGGAREAALPVGVPRPLWNQRFADHVAMLTLKGASHASIKLDPPELGPMTVRIQQQEGGTHIQFNVNNPIARDLVDSGMQRLRDLLESHGFANVDVDVSEFEQKDTTNDQDPDADGRGLLSLEQDEMENQANKEPTDTYHEAIGIVDIFA